MAKRAATPDSDDEGSRQSTPAPKRARTSTTGNGGGRQQAKGKAKARRRDDEGGDDDEEEEDEEYDEEEENEADAAFEDQNREAIMAAMEAKRGHSGTVAEHGILESIEMHQFMCHKYLTFTFGPQINFIIGHNGSGKSAVLSAITVVLGGKASATGRGNGIKSFIREGQSAAEITIQIKNQGEEAYKPKEYGKSIYITRRFTKDGGSTWKIKGKDGRVISTKKEELSAICDHMNIQVDNPMNVLTQDSARQFLSASHPTDKYKFFLRGTQLSQLSEEYEICMENINTTAKVLSQKKEAIPDLRDALREAKGRLQEAEKAKQLEEKENALKKEKCWAHVYEKEGQLEQAAEELASAEARLSKIKGELEQAEAALETVTKTVTDCEDATKALGSIDHLEARRSELRAKIHANKKKISDYMADIKQINLSVTTSRNQIKDFDKQIKEETRRLEADTQAKREESQSNIEAARAAVKAGEAQITTIADGLRAAQDTQESIKQDGEAKDRELSEMKRKIINDQQMLERVKEAEKNKLVAYGTGIPQLLENIKRARWVGDTPLGPLGMFVKVKEPEKWADVLRCQLGNVLTAFAVTDARDQKTLKQMLVASGNAHTLIIIYEKDLFDFSSGEPPEEFLTVHRALEVSNDYALRILVNQARIERILLGESRREGETALRRLQGGGVAWTADRHLLRRFPEGGEATQPIQAGRVNTMLLSGRDAAGEKEHYQKQLKATEASFNELSRIVAGMKTKWGDEKNKIQTLKAQEQTAHRTVANARARLQSLLDAVNDEMPANIAGLEGAKTEAEAELETFLKQFEDITRQKSLVDDENGRYVQEQAAVKTQMDAFESTRQASINQTSAAAQERMKAQNRVRHYQAKIGDEEKVIAAAQGLVARKEGEFEDWTRKANEYCAPVKTRRSPKDLEKEIEGVGAALKARAKRTGIDSEVAKSDVERAEAKLQVAEGDIRQMAALNKTLRASLATRLARWQEFRRHIALRCKYVFQYHLSHRGYYGKVLFDHTAQKLELKVQTDEIAATQGSREKDPRSLSGGEKSFSTICLLLSLWESIGCPLRCLDEFDVFMDAVNRRISMKMMIDTANQSDKKQYILITPQDMGNVQLGPSVRVHRMSDPERGQGLLQFS